MKPQETELVGEISKLQSMVVELKAGFSSALWELSQIQSSDSFLREELEESRRSCHKRAHRLETLVDALREELTEMRAQILQLYSQRPRPQTETINTKLKENAAPVDPTPESSPDPSPAPAPDPDLDLTPVRSRCQCSGSRGKLLLHCFLQGLKAGLSEGTVARHQVAMQLLHSEWEYVSTLNQLYDKYRSPPDHHLQQQPYQTYVQFVEQLLQKQLLFRNTLQERLSAEHWKSLVGDILVQLIGHNDTSFSDMYLGYTTTLASFLSLEFNRINQTDKTQKLQSGDLEREEMKLLSLLLAPVSRIHGYLSHIQSLLQWTGKDHPDCSLLLGSERSLRSLLNQCHQILEQDVRWEQPEGATTSSDAPPSAGPSGNCNHQSREKTKTGSKRDDPALPPGLPPCPSLRVECLSCSPTRRKTSTLTPKHQKHPQEPLPPSTRDCPHCSQHLLTPHDASQCWGETSDSGQGTYTHSYATVGPTAELRDGDTDDDTFDYSSVTSCSPDGTLRRERSEEEEEEDSHVPVLLKPRERTVCLRWQIPRLTPHPPLRSPEEVMRGGAEEPNRRLVTVMRGSPPLHPKSAFRPIWDDPTKQLDSAPERDSRQGFVPIQAPRSSFQLFNTHRENLRQSLLQQRGAHPGMSNGDVSTGAFWEDSDSEGPCSTV